MRIPLCRPEVGSAELERLQEVLASGWLTQGPQVAALEERLRSYLGCAFAVATSSGTTALQLALLAAGVKPGDEVIVPSFTWVATAAAVEQVGARPRFCDIDLATYNIDCELLPSLLTERTRAIVPVSLFGLPADLPQITKIGADAGVTVIEDAACSLGAMIAERYCGTFTELACFSFHPRKVVTCGEGGMIVGRSESHQQLLRSLRNHGIKLDPSGTMPNQGAGRLADVDKLGFNHRLSDLQAAVAAAQLDRLENIISRRRRLAAAYNQAFADLQLLSTPVVPQGYRHIYQSYVVRPLRSDSGYPSALDPGRSRDQMMARLGHAGISTGPGTHAVHTLSYYRRKYDLPVEACPRSVRAARETLALPLFPSMSEAQIDYVITNVRSVYRETYTGAAALTMPREGA